MIETVNVLRISAMLEILAIDKSISNRFLSERSADYQSLTRPGSQKLLWGEEIEKIYNECHLDLSTGLQSKWQCVVLWITALFFTKIMLDKQFLLSPLWSAGMLGRVVLIKARNFKKNSGQKFNSRRKAGERSVIMTLKQLKRKNDLKLAKAREIEKLVRDFHEHNKVCREEAKK